MYKSLRIFQIAISTIITIASSSILMTQTFGQSDAPHANCILYKDDGYNVILQMDEHCNDEQFSQAVTYYKANGYHEAGYSDIFGTKQMHLKSDKTLP
jgi:hypothetical protein